MVTHGKQAVLGVGHEGRQHLVPDVITDRGHDVKDGLALPWGSVSERYADAHLEAHVHYGARCGGEPHHYCAVFYATQNWPLHRCDREMPDAGTLHYADGHDDWRVSMLVEVVERLEGVEERVIPSVVRLQPLDDCLSGWARHSHLCDRRHSPPFRATCFVVSYKKRPPDPHPQTFPSQPSGKMNRMEQINP